MHEIVRHLLDLKILLLDAKGSDRRERRLLVCLQNLHSRDTSIRRS